MDENTISKLSLNEELRDVEDESLREEILNGGLNGHIITSSDDLEMPTRSKLKFKYGSVTDDPVNGKTLVRPMQNRIIEKPTVTVEEYNYDGTSHGPTIIGLTDDMIVQNESNINAGTYTLIISLKGTPINMWSDFTTAPIVCEYIIKAISVSIPSVTGDFTYDGTEKSPEITGFDSNLIEKTGDLSAVNSGSYNIIFDLKDNINHAWTDGTNSIKYMPWTINKVATVISLDSGESITLDTAQLYQDINITVNGENRSIFVRSLDTSIATVNHYSNLSFRVTGQSDAVYGETDIIVTVSENDNYTESSITLHVTVKAVPSLNECSWETISRISSQGGASACWDIGDCKEITVNGNIGDYLTLNNYRTYVFILGFDHNSEIEGTGITFSAFRDIETGKDIFLRDSNYFGAGSFYNGEKCFTMNHWAETLDHYPGGWAACDLRYDILGSTDLPPSPYGSIKTPTAIGQNPSPTCATIPKTNTFMASLPSDLRSVMKPIIKRSNNELRGANYTESIDYLPIMSVYEIFAENFSTNEENAYQDQYQYYKNGNSHRRLSYPSQEEVQYYWSRTNTLSDRFNYISDGTKPKYSSMASRIAIGIAPIFLV